MVDLHTYKEYLWFAIGTDDVVSNMQEDEFLQPEDLFDKRVKAQK